MVNAHGGTLPGLALQRVLGKPFCVTEYGHPRRTPLQRGQPAAGRLAGLQDWDTFSPHGTPTTTTATGGDPALLRHRPAPDQDGDADPGSAMFRRGDVRRRTTVVAA